MKLLGRAVKIGNFFLGINEKEYGDYCMLFEGVHFFKPEHIDNALKYAKEKYPNDKCEIVDIYFI